MAAPLAQLQLSAAPLAVVGGGQPQALTATDALLLAWLALEGPTSRERLAQLLWPASGAEAARNRRRASGFSGCASSLARRTRRRQHHAQPGRRRGARSARRDAVAGRPAAPDCPELQDWLAGRRRTQHAQARHTLEARIEALEAAGDTAAALPLAQQLLQDEPLSEDAYRRVMRLHYLRGDHAAALLAFDQCEQMLKHEVGAKPSPDTLALLATVESSVALPGAGPSRHSLPAASVLRPPRLVGRRTELATLQRGLAAGHVVVLVGEAGMGKSRLLQTLAAAEPPLHASGRPGDNLVPYATIARALRQVLDLDPSAADPALRRALSPVLPELGSGAPLPRQPPVAQPVLASARGRPPAACRPWRWTTCTLPTTPRWNCCSCCSPPPATAPAAASAGAWACARPRQAAGCRPCWTPWPRPAPTPTWRCSRWGAPQMAELVDSLAGFSARCQRRAHRRLAAPAQRRQPAVCA